MNASRQGPSAIIRTTVGVFLACVALITTSASAQEVVATDTGPLRGIETDNVRRFLGIPYAAPPVDELRWQAPQPAQRWQGVRDATEFGSNCPQNPSPFGIASTDEDCLFLNVFTSVDANPGARLPVMVWMHGGAFVVGQSNGYDPTRLIEAGDVVVVTINYRIGVLGFLAHPALTAESTGASSGNYGILDQQAALRWVQRNIRAFGGDPNNVTIFGESAGGASVIAHMVSPDSAGLFHKAIVQSGAYPLNTLQTLAQAETRGTTIANNLGCDTTECLRGLSVQQLLTQTPPGGMTPNVDGGVIPSRPAAAFASGQFNQVPVINGSNRDEYTLFVGLTELASGPLTAVQYPAAVAALVGPQLAPAVVNEYPLSNYDAPGLALAAVGTDAVFACPARRANRALADDVGIYAYEFNDPNAPQTLLPPISIPYGAYHAAEIQYLFDLPNSPPLTDEQQQLAEAMVTYWTNFATTGNPNGDALPVWPEYDPTADAVLSLEPPMPVVTTDFAAHHHCAFWDRFAGG